MRACVSAALVAAAAGAAVAAAADFATCVAGGGDTKLLTDGDDGFETAVGRALYPSPAPMFYADVTSREEIRDVVKCAVEADLGICPRSGGHSFIGQSSCDGVVIDVWKMKGVEVDGSTAEVEVGSTLSEMMYHVVEKTDGKRFTGIGLCPSVGVAGYMLGGGHNPYSGKLGLTCESVEEYRYVMLDGEFMTASKKENAELFWASCGGGGAHFGILYSIKAKTHESKIFDRNVYFRYQWPVEVAGEVLEKWMDYDQDGGDSWFRLEINAGTGIYGYGACWDVGSVKECEDRLKKHAFFNVKGRVKHIVKKAKDVSEFQLFIGPHGRWGWKEPLKTPKEGFLKQNWDEKGEGLLRLYSSSFWKLSGGKPSRKTLQDVANVCSKVDKSVIAFTLCQWNPWEGKQRKASDDNAFAHRDMDTFTELIGAASPENKSGGMAELKRMEKEIKALTSSLIGGIYVSYPEFNLESKDYSYLYWGQNMARLAKLKAKHDPKGVFKQVQPMPAGEISCPGKMTVAGSLPDLTLGIDGYAGGIRPGMHLALSVNKGCSVSDAAGANVKEVDFEGSGKGKVYDVAFLGADSATVLIDGDGDCKPKVVAINSVSCSDKFKLKETATAASAKKDDGSSTCFPASATVLTRDRGVVRMDDLRVGDSVQVASGAFSPVFLFSHQAADFSGTDFVSLTTCTDVSGDGSSADEGMCGAGARRRVVMTSGHYLLTAAGGLKAAGALQRGDALAGRQMVVDVVPAGRQTGLYNPHTLAGNIVVDGVVASCYTTAVHPVLARWLLTPLALLYRAAHYAPGLKGLIDVARPHARIIAGPMEVL